MPLKFPFSFALRAIMAALALAAPSVAQMAYSEASRVSATQLSTQAEGPSSAWANPAGLSEIHWAYAGAGMSQSITGKGSESFLTFTGAVPTEAVPWLHIGISAGWYRIGSGSTVDGATAVRQTRESGFGLAFSLPYRPARAFDLALGAAFPSMDYDVFGIEGTGAHGIDLGLLGAFRSGWGRFRFGLARHRFLRPEVPLPDGRGHYLVQGWFEHSLGWASPGEAWRTHLSTYVNDEPDLAEGPDPHDRVGVNGWEFEYRPTARLGLKLERTRIGSQSALAAIWHPDIPWLPAEGFLEAGFGHDKYDPEAVLPLGAFTRAVFGKAIDEGRGFRMHMSLGAGI